MSTPDDTGRPPSRRLDASGPGMADLAGVRLTLGLLVRWSPVVAVAALVGWALGSSVPDLGRPADATAVLGLTDQVEWPFYDAVVARQPALLQDGGVLADAEASAGLVADDVELDLDTGQTNAVIRLVVEAPTASDAVVLADAIAEALVAANLAEQRTTVQHRIDDLSTRLDGRRDRLDELNVERDEALFAGRQDDVDRARSAAIVVTNGIASLEEQLADAQAELGSLRPRIDIVAAAVAGRDRSDDVRSNAVTAALLALVAVAFVPTLDRRISRLRSPAQLRRIWPGVAVLDERRRTDLLGPTVAEVARRIGGDGRLAVTILALDPISAAALADDDLADRYDVVAPETGRWTDAWATLLEADAVVVVARRGTVRVRRAERLADELVALGVAPRAVVITSR